MKKLKRLGVFSLARFQAILLACLGLLLGLIYSIGGLIIDALVSLGLLDGNAMGTPGLTTGTLLAMGALFAMPVIFGSIGFVLGLVEAPIYNAIIGRFGGIGLEHE